LNSSNWISFTLLGGIVAFCQSTAKTPRFDVATIKPTSDKTNQFMMPGGPHGGLYRATGVTLKMLMMYAYGVPAAFQVSGGPSWVGSERWDIQAKVEGESPSRDQFVLMLRSLIEDRFKLKVRRETKEIPVYELVVVKGGSKLTPHSGDPPKPQDRLRMRFGSMTFQDSGLDSLAYQISLQLGRQVNDKTGLTGKYDFTLEWAPEPGQGGPESIGFPPDPLLKLPPVDPNRPSIFTALQEQLGLRLEPAKGPVEVLVIDHVDRPDKN
jgi:bla regulator protein blaR1